MQTFQSVFKNFLRYYVSPVGSLVHIHFVSSRSVFNPIFLTARRI